MRKVIWLRSLSAFTVFLFMTAMGTGTQKSGRPPVKLAKYGKVRATK